MTRLEAIEAIVTCAKEWCEAVDHDGSWDGWDHHYKNMKWNLLPALTAAALTDEANARLSAAAADLLSALKLFTAASMSETRMSRGESFIGWQQGDGIPAHERLKIARAAIAKATAAARTEAA